VSSIYPASDPDLYIMLATGRYVAQTGQAPSVDLWSHTAHGNAWMMHEWLSSLIFYGLFSLWGVNAIIIFKALLLSASFVLAMLIMRLRGVSPQTALATASLALLAANHGFGERIQAFAFFFLTFVILWSELRRKGRLPFGAYLPVLLILMAVWSNIHFTHVLGVFIIGLYFIDEIIAAFRKKAWALIVKPAVSFAAVFAATGLNPYGFSHAVVALSFYFSPEMQQADIRISSGILEYQPLLSPGFSREPMVVYGLIWIAFSLAGMILGWRRLRFSFLVLWALFTWWSFGYVRFLWLQVFTTMAGVGACWQGALEYLSSKFKVRSSKFRLTSNAAFAGLAILVFAGAVLYQRSGKHLWQRAGLGWKPRMYSDAGAGFLKKNMGEGKVLNDFDIGGYLLWKEIPVFVDGRIAPYVGTDVLKDHFRIFGGRLDLLDSYGIDWIIMPYFKTGQTDAFLRFNKLLKEDGKWALVFWDDASLIYARRTDKYRAVIDQFEYSYVNPAVFDFGHPPREYLGELERKLAEEPGALMPRIMAGNYFFYNGDAAMAEREFKKVLEADPDNAPAHNNLGNAYLRQGRLKEAISSYKKAVKLDVNLGLAYSNWGYALEALGDVKKAVKLYAIATRVTPGDAWPHNRLGEIEMKRGNRAKALEHWRRGAAIDPGSEAARNLWKETEGR
jgi:tetratricopeptide (TPR) repeat protein